MLEKIKVFMKSWGLGILMVLVLFKSCGTGSNANKAADNSAEAVTKIDSLEQRITVLENNAITEKMVTDEMEEVMLDFLIYEDELDKKKITISQIKDKIESND